MNVTTITMPVAEAKAKLRAFRESKHKDAEEVYLPPQPPFLINARAIVDRVLDTDLVRVTYSRNGRTIERVLLLTDLRPTGRTWNPATRTFAKEAAK